MAFVLFEEITCFQLCALCAFERDGSRVILLIRPQTTRFSDFCDISAVN